MSLPNRRLVGLVGRAPDCSAGGLGGGPAPDRTNTQGLKITVENMLPL